MIPKIDDRIARLNVLSGETDFYDRGVFGNEAFTRQNQVNHSFHGL